MWHGADQEISERVWVAERNYFGILVCQTAERVSVTQDRKYVYCVCDIFSPYSFCIHVYVPML